ncbi:hypothetical protein AB0P41_23075 [Streptomyces sp. NPDC079167]|uniref:hypothetical protein n=1 Tax=Streptomyces sp. NPDC079167 TaxID=3154513 RepID=UPI0034149281
MATGPRPLCRFGAVARGVLGRAGDGRFDDVLALGGAAQSWPAQVQMLGTIGTPSAARSVR